ncbi:MAG: hypothetical protein LCH84_04695 [Gemmatimonadetes bacterium]|nr:hypothetical protein [Gemmatimonadota bacterium]
MTMPPTPPAAPEENTPPELPRWARKPARMDVLSEERMAAYFGEPKWTQVYRRKLAPFLEDATFVPTWNWSAALAALVIPPIWFLYRKLYLPFALFLLVPGLAFRALAGRAIPATRSELLAAENSGLALLVLAVQVSAAIAAGGTANWFLFRRARAASQFAAMQELPAADDMALVRRMGGVNRTATSLFLAIAVMVTLAQLAG